MSRLIDADELLKHKTDHEYISTHLIYNAPTVDAIPTQAVRDAIEEISNEINKESSVPYYICDDVPISDIGIGLQLALNIIRKHTKVGDTDGN